MKVCDGIVEIAFRKKGDNGVVACIDRGRVEIPCKDDLESVGLETLDVFGQVFPKPSSWVRHVFALRS